MARIAEFTPDSQPPFAELVAVYKAVEDGLRPWVRAYEALCRSPELEHATQVVNALNRELSRSTLVRFLILLQTGQLLIPATQAEAATVAVADADAWYRECVEYAWLRR